MHLKRLQLGKVNRVQHVLPAPGGKAAHVAMVLKTLGAEPTWLGFAGGTTGTTLVAGLKELSIPSIAVPISAETRTNLEIIDANGVTEILEPGPQISATELIDLKSAMTKALAEFPGKNCVVLSGSLPAGAPNDTYQTLVDLSHQSGCRVFLDTGGEALRLALGARPDFIKPNRDEAQSWSGAEVHGPSPALAVLNQMLQAGAASGALSLGAEGIVWHAPNQQALFAQAPAISARSAVGSGDSTLAAFVYADQQSMSPSESLRLATACGAANCLADLPGQARAHEIAELKTRVHIEELN